MKYSIRDLLWLMMVIGLFFAWAMDRRNMDSEIERSSKSVHEIDHKRLIQDANSQETIERLEQVIEHLRREGVRRKHAEEGILVYPF